jgi:hypothetical protein
VSHRERHLTTNAERSATTAAALTGLYTLTRGVRDCPVVHHALVVSVAAYGRWKIKN